MTSIPASASRHRARSRPEARTIDAAKEAIQVIDLAGRLVSEAAGKWRREGEEWVGRCPLPDHEDRTPSFKVNTEKNAWFCHGCIRGGSVIDLAMLAWEIPEPKAAAMEVLLAFGHELPARPAAYFRKQQRQREERVLYEEARIGATRRRVYKLLRRDQLQIGNAAPGAEEREAMWRGADAIARLIVGDRMKRKSA